MKKTKKLHFYQGGIIASLNIYKDIPGDIIAYWISKRATENFKKKKIGDVMITREGMATGDNDRFLRLWFEINISAICFGATDFINALAYGKKWFPYNKGGSFRKWYGNNEYVVNWYKDGFEIKNSVDKLTGRLRTHNYNGIYSFNEGLTWSSLSSGAFSIRYCTKGFLFDSKGAKGFMKEENLLYLMAGILNSSVSQYYLSFLAPTLDYKVGDIIEIPFIETIDKKYINIIVAKCIDLTKKDWDNYETSWDFKRHPLI